MFLAYCAVLLGTAAAYFPALNMEQDLRPAMNALRGDVNGRELLLLSPDETTEAVVDMAGLRFRRIDWNPQPAAWMEGALAGSRFCILVLSSRTVGPVAALRDESGCWSRSVDTG